MKTTNFFQTLAALNLEGDWQISIKAAGGSRMLVSVLFINDKVGDNARKLIPPMILKGTVQELDEGFFTSIETPVKQTASLFVNMEAYAKAQEQARLQSKMEQDKHQQQKKQNETGNKKYEAAMKKVADLEAAGKFREAYAQLPKPTDFPEYEQAITEKKEELMAKFESTGLFS
ncbi:MAG: PRTRC system protein E [Chitinophagaceae bacterium]|nr:PRTRC system protein E [Chitinophagaceae bacterium]